MEHLSSLKEQSNHKLFLLDNLWRDINFYLEENANDEVLKLSNDIQQLIDEKINAALLKKEQLLAEVAKLMKEATELANLLECPDELSNVESEKNLFLKIEKAKQTIFKLKAESQSRSERLKSLKNGLIVVCRGLNVKVEELDQEMAQRNSSTSLSLNHLTYYDNVLQNATSQHRTLNEKLMILKQEIKVLCEELRITESQRTSTDLYSMSSLPLYPINDRDIQKYIIEGDNNNNDQLVENSPSLFMTLQSTVTKLDDRKKELESALRRLKDAVRELLPRIHQLYIELAVTLDDPHRVRLWLLLLPKANSPTLVDQEKYIEALVNNDPSIPQRFPISIIQSCEDEYERLMKIKAEKYKAIIEKHRKTLRALWDDLHFSEEQRLSFIPGHCEEYTEEVLNAVIEEIKRLSALLEAMKPLLLQIERREWIKQEMKRFEHSASDPSRFKGSSTRLLQEEKFRKIVSKEFPKLTESLKKSLTKWQKTHGGEAFYFDGEPYIHTMSVEQCNPNFELLHLKLLTTSKPANSGAQVVSLNSNNNNNSHSNSGHADNSASEVKSNHFNSPLIHAVSQGKSKGNYTTPAKDDQTIQNKTRKKITQTTPKPSTTPSSSSSTTPTKPKTSAASPMKPALLQKSYSARFSVNNSNSNHNKK